MSPSTRFGLGRNRVLWRLSYLVLRIFRGLFGQKLVVVFLLDLAWLSKRLAFEECARHFGAKSILVNSALSEDFLKTQIAPGQSVLDIGCGEGRWLDFGQRNHLLMTGLDTSLTSIRTCQLKYPNLTYFHGTVEKYLESANKLDFDIALMSHVLEHVNDPSNLLLNVRRLTQKIIIEVPDFESDSLNTIRADLSIPFYTDADHKYEFTKSELIDLVSSCGFLVQSCFSQGGTIVLVADANSRLV